jgi:hypothetical protein
MAWTIAASLDEKGRPGHEAAIDLQAIDGQVAQILKR